MSTVSVSASGTVFDVNCTCNVLHVSRASQFDNATTVLKTILEAQDLLATGATLPANLSDAYGQQGTVSWIGAESSEVIAANWAKDVDGVVGTLSLNLKPRISHLDTFRPGDLLLVFMDDAGDYSPAGRVAGTFVTVVVVDRVGLTKHVQGGATTRSITITARDLGVIFATSSVMMDPAFAVIENASFTGDFIKQVFGDKAQIALSPTEKVLILLLLLYDGTQTGSNLLRTQWKLTSSPSDESQLVSLIDVTSWVQFPTPFYAIASPPAILQAGNVWTLLDTFANTTLNEFFVDVRDSTAQERNFIKWQSSKAIEDHFPGNLEDVATQRAVGSRIAASALFKTSSVTGEAGDVSTQPNGTSVPALVLRQRPYDAETFSRLPATTVYTTECESIEISRSSHDVFNWFRIRLADLQPISQENIRGISVIASSIAKFGFRRLDAQTIYMFLSSQASATYNNGITKTDFGDVFDKYVSILTDWFKLNDFWLSGTLTMRFKPSIRCGTRLVLSDGASINEFYVQGVNHSFSKDPGSSRTQLTLTRGRCTSTPNIPNVVVTKYDHNGFVAPEPGAAQ